MTGQPPQSLPGALARSIVRWMAVHPATRALLGAYYGTLDARGRERYHARYSTLFHDRRERLGAGEWTVRFRDRSIRLPLRPEHSWTDWANAVSIVGHDVDIKLTYENLLAAREPPEVFLDVGANFGTHSILFASQGVRTIAFEPNARCRDYCQIACELNRLDVQWEAVAIGDRDGEVDLIFPETETWLGSIAADIVGSLRRRPGALSTQRVPLRRLDDYADMLGGKRLLIKIDVEGSEALVLKGASRLIEQSAPTVLFECNDPAKRPELLSIFAGHHYGVFVLPFLPSAPGSPLSEEQFVSSPATNFLAHRAAGSFRNSGS